MGASRPSKFKYDLQLLRYLYCVKNYNEHELLAFVNEKYNVQLERKQITRMVANHGWVKVRARIERAIIKASIHAKVDDFKQTIGSVTKVINKFLLELEKSPRPMTFKDAKLASDIASNFFRIYQVTQGKPDTISQVSRMNPEQAREWMVDVLKERLKDPMFDADEFLKSEKSPSNDKLN